MKTRSTEALAWLEGLGDWWWLIGLAMVVFLVVPAAIWPSTVLVAGYGIYICFRKRMQVR